ncbi:MAG: thiol reductant ABC exporter subunit CydC [Actinomycetales bacterium]|uniref:Thiol reductant ABC exporter subunit CydC n=1 Tax=Candidatus Phosphoribacter hodrii TaxID=2953743 RepID=A0A9D7T7T2_9MICO|nr:thiol reductant ABC exporter subunit CydC [Candidatus Phosphoribacter hodrii]
MPRFGWEATVADAPETQQTTSAVVEAAFEAQAPGIKRAAVIGGLASASGIALTATSGWLIVAASHQPVILTLLAVIVAVRTFGIARPVLRYAERVRSHDSALDLLARRRVAAYQALVPLTPARLGRRSRSDVLTTAVEDLEDLVFAKVRVVVPVLGLAVAAVLTVLALGLFVPAGSLVLVAVLLAQVGVSALGRRMELAAQQDWLRARAEVARTATLVTGYAAQLRGIGAGPQSLGWVREAHLSLSVATRRLARARATGVALGHVVTGVGTILAALVAHWAMGVGLNDAVAAVVVLAPLAVGDAFVGLPDAMGAWARARGSEARLRDLLDQPPAVHDPAPLPDPLPIRGISPLPGDAGLPRISGGESSGSGLSIDVTGVAARWWPEGQGAAYDVGPVTLSIGAGEHLVLTGANGSGKSTLLAVLARHLDPAAGSYCLGGVDVTTVPLAEIRAHVAVVDDEPHIFASSLRENLRLARPDADDGAIEAAIRAAGLAGWFDSLTEGLDTMLGTGGRGVSGGERARLALARAHVSNRPVVLLDEPVAHLDHATALAVLADAHRAFAGRTVVMVSHRPDGLDGFDRVVDLADLADT